MVVADKLEIKKTNISKVVARQNNSFKQFYFVALSVLRASKRDIEAIAGSLFIPFFFYIVNIGSFESLSSGFSANFDYRAFQLPVAVLFAVTGTTRAYTMVLNIKSGYFTRLSLAPINKFTLLLGVLAIDILIATMLILLVLVLGFIFGVGFETGVAGILVFILYSAAWALAYNMIPYAIAFKTGNPAMVNISFLLFFPVIFLSPLFIPREFLTGWLQTVSAYNPVTYILEGARALISGWDATRILLGLAAIFGVLVVTLPITIWALGKRTTRN